MLEHADIIVTARVTGQLVGVSRAVTDFAFCTYLSDLAVDAEQPALSLSVGVAEYPRDGETVEALLGVADHALYEAKAGRIGHRVRARGAALGGSPIASVISFRPPRKRPHR